ncbi:MAG: glycoside hydrolase [Treponema sp.]|nr:glycoside hydrolase [Treponema sp.]
MKKLIVYLFFFLFAGIISCSSVQETAAEIEANTEEESAAFAEHIEAIDIPQNEEALPVSSFVEVWAYLLSGREETLSNDFPLSDVGYFGAEVDTYGKLINVPNSQKIAGFAGRIHLVVTCNSNRSVNHFVLRPGSEERRQLIADLLAATEKFDGLQIDFEIVPARDAENFRSFLQELRNGLGSKMFTVAFPARLRTLQDDVYDYAKIVPIVDKILVMAYDEHWSTSKPGPIASIQWCQSIAQYAMSVIPHDKLIMGIPFYGRTWGDYSTNRAFLHSGIERIKEENGVTEVERLDGIPHFTFEVPVTITTYYEDNVSLSTRMEMYKSLGIQSIGFWCLGQESETFWNYLNLGD